MRQRRTRFTAVVQKFDVGVEQKVILAYDPGGVREYYEARGWTVIAIHRGDYRYEQAKRTAGGWRVNQAALKEAIDFLGIKLPVRVKQTGRRGPQQGAHYFRQRFGQFMKNPDKDTASGGFYHHITVKNYLTAEEAGRTIWHELAHAMQAERETANAATMREAFDAWKFCSARGRGITYRAKPIEVEAREHECLNDDNPLAR